MKLKEIAERIDAHLKRFEKDPKLNKDRSPKKTGLYDYYWSGASYSGGSRLAVTYIAYQGASHLTRDEALKYLAWLDAGNVGRHFEALR